MNKKKFTLFWKDGYKEIIYGDTVEEALVDELGYSPQQIPDLMKKITITEEGDCINKYSFKDYTWVLN